MERRLTQSDDYLFGLGRHYEIYEKLGAHPTTEDGEAGVYFAVWAPHAQSVSVVGNFNEWTPKQHLMSRREDSGIFELFIPGLQTGEMYKYAVETSWGEILYKVDPYGNYSEIRPGNASVVTDISDFAWDDDKWQEDKKNEKAQSPKKPMAIYEVHLGSWKKDETGANFGFLNYRRLAHELAEYVNYMGYTHVELIGIAEHPFDGSWGYQVTGYYAPTARYGTPEDFMYFVNYMHDQGIGVILDWVPAHFPKDAHGLGRFDGEALYEHPDSRKGEHTQWGTYIFNYEKPQVANFLIANALFWLEKFHIDGLRVDAVASMLYLDYGREQGQWVPNKDGGNKNYEVMEFLKHLNSILVRRNPGTMMIAEESTAFPKVTWRAEDEGLGFSYKWNMGWMHDFLNYMQLDPYFRQHHHNELTFSFTYAFAEKYILVLSHDEVVHMKGSMLNKMPGDMPHKFANLRAAYGLMMSHPGKKLLFMGQDFGQLREWSEERSLDWYLLDQELSHRQLNNYYRDLLALYKDNPAMYELDCEEDGFKWVFGADASHNMLTFCRMTKDKKKCILFHFNFSPVEYRDFRIGCPCPGTYTEIFNDDKEIYGGTGLLNPKPIEAEAKEWDWNDYSMEINVPAYGMVAMQFDYVEPPKKTDEDVAETSETAKPAKKPEMASEAAKPAKKPEAVSKTAEPTKQSSSGKKTTQTTNRKTASTGKKIAGKSKK